MSEPSYLVKWTVWCMGSHVANASEYTPPALGMVEAEFRGGHMDMPLTLDDGMEAMSVTLKLAGLDESLMPMFGFQPGKSPRITVREGYVSGSGDARVQDELQGMITRWEPDARTETDRAKSGVTVTMKPTYYRRLRNGQEAILIDVVKGVRRINGVDVLKDLNDFVMGRS